mgnify:CR=1 FL=1
MYCNVWVQIGLSSFDYIIQFVNRNVAVAIPCCIVYRYVQGFEFFRPRKACDKREERKRKENTWSRTQTRRTCYSNYIGLLRSRPVSFVYNIALFSFLLFLCVIISHCVYFIYVPQLLFLFQGGNAVISSPDL